MVMPTWGDRPVSGRRGSHRGGRRRTDRGRHRKQCGADACQVMLYPLAWLGRRYVWR